MMKNKLPSSIFPFIWHFIRNYKIVAFIIVLLSIGCGFWAPINSILIKNVIDTLTEVSDSGDVSLLILPMSLIVINFIIFDNVTWRSLTYIRCRFIAVIINDIVKELMFYTLSQSHQFFLDNLSGKLSKQISHLVDGVEKLITSVVSNFLRGATMLLLSFVIAYHVNAVFFFVLLCWFVFFVGISAIMSKKFVALSDIQAATESAVIGELVDSISNQSNVRIFSSLIYEKIRVKPFFYNQRNAYRNTYFYAVIMGSIQGGLIAVMMAASSYYLVILYSENAVTIGDFALIFALMFETGHIMWFTMSELDEFNKAVGRCRQSLNALIVPLEVQDKPSAKDLICKKGNIIFDKVNFHYKDTKALFQNKSVNIKPGEKIGLVGYSGSGKSTFASLILRFYDIDGGKILIDNQDISEVTQSSLRQKIAMIPQDPSLFNRSLMDNIRYGLIDASNEQVIEAAKKAHAHEFIIQLPKGYDSLVGERGVKLSGGQRQRIAIARAILKDAPILILDEATSQLDSVTEIKIQNSMWDLMQGKTTIIIAHRLSTLLKMDRILVFNEGEIVEDGAHEELIVKNGLYKELWDNQVGGFLGDNLIKE